MPCYIVRLIGNQEFVGILNADSLAELQFLSDQVCQTDLCEFARLPSGGLIAPSDAPKVPASNAESDKKYAVWERELISSLCLDDYWGNAIDHLRWSPLHERTAEPTPPEAA